MKCMEKDWGVYCKHPATGSEKVIEYLARYAFRVAISNSRILDYKDDKVTYDWKDYKDGGRHKKITMDATDFVHLFSLHILPARFVKCRHYGLLAPSNRDKLRNTQIQLNGTPVPKNRTKKSFLEICSEKGWEIGICPNCKCPMIVLKHIMRAPPPQWPLYQQILSQAENF